MKSQDKISNNKRNWYIAEIIEKCEPVDRNENLDLRRVTTWGNFHLIKADTPEKAYEKAVKIGKDGEYKFINADKHEMEWVFVGIADLIPVCEDIEDGAELMWTDYGFISDRRTQRIPRKKEDILNGIKPKA